MSLGLLLVLFLESVCFIFFFKLHLLLLYLLVVNLSVLLAQVLVGLRLVGSNGHINVAIRNVGVQLGNDVLKALDLLFELFQLFILSDVASLVLINVID